MLSRITAPTTGQIDLFGRVGSLLEVGTGFHPELTGRENIFLNGAILGMTRSEVRSQFDEIVAFSGVERFLETPVKRYSSGMYVRLAFAVAAHLRTEILIIDEVLAVGDVEFQKKCIGKMQDVASGEGRTVLFVSHNMDSVERLCDSVVFLNKGHCLGPMSPREGIGRYLEDRQSLCESTYTADAGVLASETDAEARLVRAVVRNGGDVSAGRLQFGESFSIEMVWDHRRSTSGMLYTLRFHDARDRLICVANTVNEDLDLDRPGEHRAVCRFEMNPFPPGQYYVDVGAHIRPYKAVQHIDRCLRFEVDEVSVDGKRRYSFRGDPAVAIPFNWALEATNPHRS